jgi:hypothetical protein
MNGGKLHVQAVGKWWANGGWSVGQECLSWWPCGLARNLTRHAILRRLRLVYVRVMRLLYSSSSCKNAIY